MVANNLGTVPFWEFHFPIQKIKSHKVELEVKFEEKKQKNPYAVNDKSFSILDFI